MLISPSLRGSGPPLHLKSHVNDASELATLFRPLPFHEVEPERCPRVVFPFKRAPVVCTTDVPANTEFGSAPIQSLTFTKKFRQTFALIMVSVLPLPPVIVRPDARNGHKGSAQYAALQW